MERRKEAEDNTWLQYFESIKDVCPWSYESYIEGRIKIVSFDQKRMLNSEVNWAKEPWDAIVYVVEGLTLDEMDDIVADQNDCQEICEYLWSYPTFTKGRNKQAPHSIIIQQDRATLIKLRAALRRKK